MYYQQSQLRNIISQINDEKPGAQSYFSNELSIPKVIAVSGGKGGIGKTLTTANLGLCLASQGMRVLLIDADFGLANLDVVLNIRPTATIDDVLTGERALTEVIAHGPMGVHVIPASSGSLKVPELGRMQRLMLLDQIESMNDVYDVVLIDTAAGVNRNVQYWTSSASEVVIISSPEPTSMSDAYATMKILSQTTGESTFKLIVNMAHSYGEGIKVYERLSTIAEEHLNIKLDFLGVIEFDDAVRRSVRERSSYVIKYPLCQASRGIREISKQILDNQRHHVSKGTAQFFWRKMICAGQPNFGGV